MNPAYEIVRYRPEFRAGVVELQKYLWSPDLTLNSAYLAWKHERNPYVSEPLLYLALHAGRVVGMRSMFGVQWQFGDAASAWRGLCAADLVIAPEHRNRALFSPIMKLAMADAAERGHKFVFNLSASRFTYLASLRMGWRGIGPQQTLQWKRKGSPEETCVGPFDAGAADQIQVSDHVSFAVSPQPDSMAELVERLGGDERLRHIRDRQYFAWRFQNPLSQYRFVFWRGSRLEGYLVLQRSVSRDAPVANIVDWAAASVEVETDLIDAVVRRANLRELTLWSAALPERMRMVLQDSGFVQWDDPQRTAALVRPTEDDMRGREWVVAKRNLLDVKNWDIRMIYSDGA